MRTTAFFLREGAVSEKRVATVARHFEHAIRSNTRVRLLDPDRLLAEFSGEVPSARLKEARSLLESGLAMLKEQQFEGALERLTQSEGILRAELAFTKKRELALATIALGVTYAELNIPQKAVRTFADLLTWRPNMRYDTTQFPLKHRRVFKKARAIVAKRRKGSVALATSPIGARAYVDGIYAGVTPTEVFGLVAGRHFVTFRKNGYIKRARTITVSHVAQKAYETTLNRSEKALIIDQALRSAQKHLGRLETSNAMHDISRVLVAPQLIFAVLRQTDRDLQLDAYLYDTRSHLLLNHVRGSASAGKSAKPNAKRVTEVASLLHAGVRYDGKRPTPPPRPPPTPTARQPVYKKWWFWTAIAAGAASIAVPAVFWPRGDSCASGHRCVTISN